MLFSSLTYRTFSIAVTTTCSVCLALIAQADGDLRTVALTGDQVPGADPGVVFNSFPVTPVLNAAGQTAFQANLTGKGVMPNLNSKGIYSEGGGSLAEVTRAGKQAPGASPGVMFSDFIGFEPLVLNAAGQTSFFGQLAGPAVNGLNNNGIYSERGGSLVEVAREGNQAPGAETGVVFGSLSFPVFNAAGQTAFLGGLSGMNVDATNDTGIYSEGSGSLAEVARTGTQVPDADPGVVFSFLSSTSPVLNGKGQTAFFARITGPGVNFTNDAGIFSERNGSLAEVAREGNQVPGADSGILFDSFSSSVVLNSAGQTAFIGLLTGSGVGSTNDRGIYSERGGTLGEVARMGSEVPGTTTGVVFNTFTNPVLNSAGQTAFVSSLTGPNVNFTNNIAIFSEGSGNLAEVARKGGQAPGALPGVMFFGFGNSIELNAAGQTAFLANLAGSGVNAANDLGIYATNRDGLLVEIVRKGSLIDVSDDPLIDDLRMISQLSVLANTGNQDGRGSNFNDVGQLVFSATFTDGSEGIFVSNRVAFTPVPGDFDLDGEVDGRDFLVWQRNPAVGDLADWQLNYGFDSSALSTASVVPEPATAALIALCLPALLRRRNSVGRNKR